MASGVVPADEKIIKGDWEKFRPVQGEKLSEEKEYGVEVAQDLAAILGMKPGSTGVVMATTPDGQMNALDIEVAGVEHGISLISQCNTGSCTWQR